MIQKIDELYNEEEYNPVVYYFNKRGIYLIKDLITFDFTELFFIPGISEKLALEVEAVFRSSFQGETKVATEYKEASTNQPNYQSSDVLEDAFLPLNQENLGPTEPECSILAVDKLITDVYSGISRSAPFIRYCFSVGKTRMSQLSDEDFEKALYFKGLGKYSVKILYDIYRNNIKDSLSTDQPQEIKTYKSLRDISLEYVYGDITHGNIFIRYCYGRGIHTIADLEQFSFDASQVKGIGVSSMEKIHQVYLKMLEIPLEIPKEPVVLKNIPEINVNLPIEILSCFEISDRNVNTLIGRGFLTVRDLCKNALSPYEYELIRKAVPLLTIPLPAQFANALKNIKEIAQTCLIQRCQGSTLQKISNNIGITRERVRQIIVKACVDLKKNAEMVADYLLQKKDSFSATELYRLFDDLDSAYCCKFVLLESTAVLYLGSSDKFIRKSLCPNNLENILHQFADDVISEGLNFYDNLESIESSLQIYGLDFLDFEDIMNYLVKRGYRFYGDYVAKSGTSYANVCYNAILKYFPFDIKLDNDEKNEDMIVLRRIIERHYHGLYLPDNNHSLTARVAPFMILSGRGRYCPVEKVLYNTRLLDEVLGYIQESRQTSFYYTELYSMFRGRFLAETNISNAHFLHGILKYLYPNDFNFKRGLMVKSGEAPQNIEDRLCNLIIANKCSTTKSEIKKMIPGVNDFVIASAVARNPELIQWEFNIYNHIENISFDSDDNKKISEILADGIKKHNGYLSDTLFFKDVQIGHPEFIVKNNIKNAQNLYYIAGYYFKKDYRFSRPHILSQDFPVTNLTTVNIAKALLCCDTNLNYTSYLALAESVGWANGTLYAVFSELEKEFVRVSEEDYVIRDVFTFSNTFLEETKKNIGYFVESSGYYALSSVFSFNSFPECQFEWNGFLLESIIEEYGVGYKIIHPQVKDRRYQRGIILPKGAPQLSFEDLVTTLMKRDGIVELSEFEMQKYLKNKGLIFNTLPQELYEYPALIFKEGNFTLCN